MPQAAYDSAVLALSGLNNYWKLTETSGTSFTDSKGSNALAAAASPSRTTGPDGTASAINVAATTNSVMVAGTNFAFPKDHTVFYWMKLNSQSAGDMMAFEWATSSFTNYVQSDIGYSSVTGKSVFSAYYGTVTGAAAELCDRSTFGTGTWVFVAITTDTTLGNTNETKLYVNGVHVGTASAGFHQTQTPGSGALGVGGRAQGGRGLPLDGALNGVGILGRVMTTTEMTTLYQRMTGKIAVNQVSELETALPISVSHSGRILVEDWSGDPNGWNHNAFPGMVRSTDGSTLILGYQHQDQHQGTAGTVRIRRIDTQNGSTIGSPFDIRTVLVADPDTNLADISLWRMSNGEIGILWNESSTPGTANINTVVTYKAAFSSNEGVTWGTPITITTFPFVTNGAGTAGAYGIAPTPPIELAAGTVLKNGSTVATTTQLAAVYGYDDKTIPGTASAPGYVKVYKSTDFGRTWSSLSTPFPASTTTYDSDETALRLLNNGQILSMSRTAYYPTGRGNGTAYVQRAVTSDDGGSTWTTPIHALGSGVVGQVGYGGRPDLIQTPNGVLFARCRVMSTTGTSSYPSYRRSDDNGITWSAGRDPWDLALERTTSPDTDGTTRGVDVYSASAQLLGSNDTIAFIWAEERQTGTTPPNKAAIYYRTLVLRTQAISQPVETDVAMPIKAVKTRSIGQAIETDVATVIPRITSVKSGKGVIGRSPLVFVESGSGVSTFVGSGPKSVSTTKSGAGISSLTASGVKVFNSVTYSKAGIAIVGRGPITFAPTGSGVSTFSASGTKTLGSSVIAKTGAGVTAFSASGVKFYSGLSVTYTKSGSAGLGHLQVISPKTGVGVLQSIASGSSFKTDASIIKSGGGRGGTGTPTGWLLLLSNARGFSASGVKIFTSVSQETATAASLFSGSGVKSISFTKSGSGITNFTAAGPRISQTIRTGRGISPRVVSGSRIILRTKSGAAASDLIASGPRLANLNKTGLGALVPMASGSKTIVSPGSTTYSKTGRAVTDLTATGNVNLVKTTTGISVSAFAASGVKSLTYTKVGSGISAFAAKGPDSFTRLKTGAGEAGMRASGMPAYVYHKSGLGASDMLGSGLASTAPITVSTKSGTAMLARSVSSPSVKKHLVITYYDGALYIQTIPRLHRGGDDVIRSYDEKYVLKPAYTVTTET
jgi:hypothetical protein